MPAYHPDRDPPFDVYYRQVLEQVELAEQRGFEAFWCTEHHFLLYGGPVPNPAVFTALVAGRTSKIRMGSSISILPLHHPLQVAEDYAMDRPILQNRCAQISANHVEQRTSLAPQAYLIASNNSKVRELESFVASAS